MDISQIDENFKLPTLDNVDDIEWFNASETPFSLRGVFYSKEDKRYLRLPLDVAKTVSAGVAGLATHTAGGRVCFLTNSPYVAIKCVIPRVLPMNHMPLGGSHGFTIYADGAYAAPMYPNMITLAETQGDKYAFQSICRFPEHLLQEMCIYFPLYNGVYELFIGVQKGSTVQTPPSPTKNPVVFYGSSITQGGCASRAGNDYVSILSRTLKFNYINLGFSGSAKGEQAMADYIASLHPSVFVLDYDHNAPSLEHLRSTHYNMYETFRKENPTVPVIMITKPDFDSNPEFSAKRRAVIFESYLKAKKNKDKRVFFIDGETLFGKDGRDGCTVDNCHPNDLGFYRMAQTIAPVMKKALKQCK